MIKNGRLLGTGVLDELNAELQIHEDLKGNGIKATYPLRMQGIDTRRFVKQGLKISKPLMVHSIPLKSLFNMTINQIVIPRFG
jgi:hypothetical protein